MSKTIKSREEAIKRACALVSRAAHLSGEFPERAEDCFCDEAQFGDDWPFRSEGPGFDLLDRLLGEFERGNGTVLILFAETVSRLASCEVVSVAVCAATSVTLRLNRAATGSTRSSMVICTLPLAHAEKMSRTEIVEFVNAAFAKLRTDSRAEDRASSKKEETP